MNKVCEKCYNFALQAHANQRRDNGEPYFNHLLRVASNFGNSDDLFCAAILHDVLEDTSIIEKDLEDIASAHTIEIIKTLTRNSGETYFDYIMRIKNSETLAFLIKLKDLEDNLSDLKEGSRKDKYRFAQYILNKEIDDRFHDGRLLDSICKE